MVAQQPLPNTRHLQQRGTGLGPCSQWVQVEESSACLQVVQEHELQGWQGTVT